MNQHLFSSKTNSPLSNFHPCLIRLWNLTFSSSEQAYQFFKCHFHGCWGRVNKILNARTAKECYFIGRSCKTSKEWKSEKVHVMLHILKHKFFQCELFRNELDKLQDHILIEDTKNYFWGRGSDGYGLNTLGVLLHRVRLECSE